MSILKEVVKSRKFWAALIGLLMVIIKAFDPKFPLSEDQMLEVTGVLVAYILGTGLENIGSGKGGPIPSNGSNGPPA